MKNSGKLSANSFTQKEIEQLVGLAQEHHGPTDFDKEVHEHHQKLTMPEDTDMAFDNPNQGAELQISSYSQDVGSTPSHKSVSRKKTNDQTTNPQHLEGDSWRSSPQAQSGSSTETGEDTGLP